MAKIQEDWLSLSAEEAIDPGIPICDPHHHLWDHPQSRYLLIELHGDTGSGHNVRETVFIECMSAYREEGPEELRPVGETEFVAEIAEESRSMDSGAPGATVAGIVGFADLTLGDGAVPVLEAHLEAGRGLFRGIRHAAGWDPSNEVRNSHTRPPEGLFLDPALRRGFAQLEPLGLSFDAWLYHTQLGELTSLARAFPETTIVLDHFGGPLGIGPYEGRRQEVYRDWRKSLGELAGCDNVVVKLGGLAMPINGFAWHKAERPPSSKELAEATAPYYLETIELFGVERAMFESNFPVDKVSCSYTVLWNSFQRLTESFSDTEKAALFGDTARRVYRIEE